MRPSASLGSFQGPFQGPSQHQQQPGADWYSPGQQQGPWVQAGPTYTAGSYPAPTGSFLNSAPAAYGSAASNSFADEPPLLEELGIDLGGILKKTRAILLYRLNNKVTDELDMGGALLFIFLLGGLHLLLGKLHFGIILGWTVVHSTVLWFLVNQLAGVDASEAKGLELYSVCCIVGYCLAPMAVYSALSLLLPRGLASSLLGVLCTFWSAATASKVLVRRCSALSELKLLITVPCVLLFSAFAMLTSY